MNISKSFIKDVAESMEKYGMSAGGSGGGIYVFEFNSNDSTHNANMDKMLECFNKGVNIYLRSAGEMDHKLVDIFYLEEDGSIQAFASSSFGTRQFFANGTSYDD